MMIRSSCRLWLLGVLFMAPGQLRAQTEFPYLAYARADKVIVRAGPDSRYYGTSHLARSNRVEVYKHLGRWCAIRPPQGSFSWIPSSSAKLGSSRKVATVTRPDVKSSIGTELPFRGRRKFQVVLKQGERVEILGARRVRSRSGNQVSLWYKIAPPAGEFRWVERRHLTPVPRQTRGSVAATSQTLRKASRLEKSDRIILDRAPDKPEQNGPLRQPRIVLREPKRLGDMTHARPLKAVAQKDTNRSVGQVSQIRPLTPKKSAPFNGWTRRGNIGNPSSHTSSTIRLQPNSTNVRRASAVTTAPPARRLSSKSTTKLDQLEAELSLLATRNRQQWNVADLQDRARRLAAEETSTLGRARMRRLLDKLARFAELAQQEPTRATTATTKSPTKARIRTMFITAKESPKSQLSGRSVPNGYDGVGYLWPVSSKDTTDPPYALVSDDGKRVLQFVTPAPGVSLQSYLQKKVAVQGQRGISVKWKKPHLTARKLTLVR